jgi:stearoyl-CoA desaturase (delta-9 desaturase)
MVVTWLVLFGVPGIIMIAVQLVSQPLLAAGIINGVGHHTGYRNFECGDASRNVVPWGVFLGGEELHNNHHAFPSSAKFSIRPWEFDIGWAVARVLSWVGLAKIRRVAPTPEVKPGRSIDLETARAVIVNRMHVLRNYTRSVTIPVMKREMGRLKERGMNLSWRKRRLVIRNPMLLDDSSKARVREVLNSSQALKTVEEYRQRLQAIWEGAAVSNDRLVAQLKEWCQQAEASGERVLQDFARSLRGYTMPAATA